MNAARHAVVMPTAAESRSFEARYERESARLAALLAEIYGDDPRLGAQLDGVLADARAAWHERPEQLKHLDAAREAEPGWFHSNRMLAGVCYVDRYAGSLRGLFDRIPYFEELGLTVLHLMPVFEAPLENSDGGYAVSSYRRVDPRLGSMADLRDLASQLRAAGISLVLDFVFNHTSNEHDWARRALDGDAEFEDFYWIFDDRTMPDAFEATTREIFPEDHPGSFVQLDDGRWIWATFHSFQLDLNYSNPAVFRAMAREMFFLANQGVEVLRMDAVAFIWKQLGTACENQPEAHLLLQAFNALLRIVAPAVVFLSEAIVHPDDVVAYIASDECELSYNPLQMALIWSTLATRDTGLLAQALAERHELPAGTAWVNYVRSHDDIGWTFADEDAALLGVDGFEHRRFLNRFFVGAFEGSFARGVPFQTNEKTGDSRVSGATASLAGVEAGDPLGVQRILLAQSIALSTGGVPLLYLGDEVGQLNDSSYLDDPGKSADSRWSGRPLYPSSRYAERHDVSTVAGRLYSGLRHLIELRAQLPAFAGGRLVPFETHDRHVLGYLRPGGSAAAGASAGAGVGAGSGAGAGAVGSSVLVLANVDDFPATIDPATLAALPTEALDVVSGQRLALRGGLTLAAGQFVWLVV